MQSTGEAPQFDPFGIAGSPREVASQPGSEPASATARDPFWHQDNGQAQDNGFEAKFDAFGMDDGDEDPSTPLAAGGQQLHKVLPPAVPRELHRGRGLLCRQEC